MDKDVKLGMTTMILGLAGLVIAAIEYELYTDGILIDEFVTGTISISDIMAVTIIIWLLVAVTYAVMKH